MAYQKLFSCALPKQNCSRLLAACSGTSPVVMTLEVFNTSSAKNDSRNVLAIQFVRGTTSWSAY